VSSADPVTRLTTPVRLSYRLTAGHALTRYLRGIESGRFLGSRCATCRQVYLPLRDSCPADGGAMAEEVELPDTGTITTFAVNNIPDPRAPEIPYVCGYILLDGADIAMLALVGGIPADQVRMGMRVRAQWAPPEQRRPDMTSITYFTPTGEPDAPFESIRAHT